MSIRTLSKMQADERLQPDPVTCPFCKATVVFVREGKRVIARCTKPCGYEVQKEAEMIEKLTTEQLDKLVDSICDHVEMDRGFKRTVCEAYAQTFSLADFHEWFPSCPEKD